MRLPLAASVLLLASSVKAQTVAAPAPIAARPEPCVLLVVPAHRDAPLAEALVRARGELDAVGLRVELQVDAEPFGAAARPDAGEAREAREVETSSCLAVGQLGFQRTASAWLVTVSVAGAVSSPHHFDHPASTAPEVIAVRGIEALRAALLEHVARLQLDPQRLPDPVRRFVQVPPRGTVQVPPRGRVPQPRVTTPAPAARAQSHTAAWHYLVLAGPTLDRDLRAARTAAGVRLGALAGLTPWFTGMIVDGTWMFTPLRDASGSVAVARTRLTAVLELHPTTWRSTELTVRLGAGASRYRLGASPAVGFIGHDLTHLSPHLLAALGITHWLNPRFGLSADLGASLATDPPRVRLAGEEVARLDAPTFTAALGVVTRWGR